MSYATEEERQEAARKSDEKRRAQRYILAPECKRTVRVDDGSRFEPSPEALADRERRLSWPRTLAQIHCGDPPFPQSALGKLQLATGGSQ
jgi:hypothetical protein